MSISGTILYNKVREIMPGLSSSITPEVLNKTCDDSTVQPFLKWFCSSLERDNILLPEDVRLKKHIQKKGEWLKGKELDAALTDATKDCPELMKFLRVDLMNGTRLSDELEAEKDAYKQDRNYLRTLEESLRSLKELEMKLDEDIETEESQLKKDRIQVHRAYMDCIGVVEESDSSHREFFKDIENLVKVYSDGAEKKGAPIVWTQVPLDLFVKQMEMHNDYLGVYVKRQFGGKIEQDNDSDYEKLIDEGKERSNDEKVHELLNCQTNVITSKTDEINAKVEETVCSAMAAHAVDIYNSGSLRTPQSETQLRVEIDALMGKRDFLEENIALIRDTQLEEVVRQYARLVITKILVNDGHSRAERRKNRLAKLENLRHIAREKGHGHSDLLCMLMQLQLRRLKEIVEFIADGRYYLATEYNLSSVRSENMRQEQAKFDEIMKHLPREQNIFNKIFISLLGTEPQQDELTVAIRQYDDLVAENERRMKALLGVQLDTKIAKISELHREVMSIYNTEVEEGPTNSFKSTPHRLITRLDESTKSVRDMQNSVNQIRAKIKDMHRKTADNSFERTTTILWQLFLANHDELQSKYDEANRRVESSHFVDTLDV